MILLSSCEAHIYSKRLAKGVPTAIGSRSAPEGTNQTDSVLCASDLLYASALHSHSRSAPFPEATPCTQHRHLMASA